MISLPNSKVKGNVAHKKTKKIGKNVDVATYNKFVINLTNCLKLYII